MSINLFPVDGNGHNFMMSQADNDFVNAHMKMGFSREACLQALRNRSRTANQSSNPLVTPSAKAGSMACRTNEAHFAIEQMR